MIDITSQLGWRQLEEEHGVSLLRLAARLGTYQVGTSSRHLPSTPYSVMICVSDLTRDPLLLEQDVWSPLFTSAIST